MEKIPAYMLENVGKVPVYTFAADKDIEFTYRAKVTSGTVHETLLTQAILGEMKDGAIVPVSSFEPVSSPALQALYGSKDMEFDLKDLPSGYYDLQGRPVKSPQRGIYIHSGKKVIIK